MDRTRRGLVALALAVSIAGCDADDRSVTDQTTPTTESRTEDDTAQAPSVARPSESSDETTLTGKTVTTPSGAVVALPEQPASSALSPESGCRHERDGRFSVWFPPRPGVRVRRLGAEVVRLDYRFSGVAARCRPVALEITFDVNDDPLPGATARVRITRLFGRVDVPVPTRVHDADVARVIAVSRRRAPSDAAAVRIPGR